MLAGVMVYLFPQRIFNVQVNYLKMNSIIVERKKLLRLRFVYPRIHCTVTMWLKWHYTFEQMINNISTSCRIVGSYLATRPDYCFLVESQTDGVIGYVCAALDSKQFNKNNEVMWQISMQEKYPKPTKVDDLTPTEVSGGCLLLI